MASPAALDLENLLAPIADDNPCGHDPRLDMSPTAPFLTVKDAYNAARDAERYLERGVELPEEAHESRQKTQRGWATVCEAAPQVIGAIGKDLRVAVWLTEALLRQRGLAGLRDGLQLTSGLVERYWDGLFPQPAPEPDEDEDPRLFSFASLAESREDRGIAPVLRQVPLSDGSRGDPVRLWEFEKRPSADQDREAAEAVEQRLRQSAETFKRDLIEDAEACVAAATALETALDARCGRNAPSFALLRRLVGEIGEAMQPYADLPADLPAAPEQPAAEAPAEAPQEASPRGEISPQPAGNGLDRQRAFRQLEEIAAFFRRTEPHSPIAYALENIVRRGRMSLPELLRELISDDTARQSYFITAGMQPPDEKSA